MSIERQDVNFVSRRFGAVVAGAGFGAAVWLGVGALEEVIPTEAELYQRTEECEASLPLVQPPIIDDERKPALSYLPAGCDNYEQAFYIQTGLTSLYVNIQNPDLPPEYKALSRGEFMNGQIDLVERRMQNVERFGRLGRATAVLAGLVCVYAFWSGTRDRDFVYRWPELVAKDE